MSPAGVSRQPITPEREYPFRLSLPLPSPRLMNPISAQSSGRKRNNNKKQQQERTPRYCFWRNVGIIIVLHLNYISDFWWNESWKLSQKLILLLVKQLLLLGLGSFILSRAHLYSTMVLLMCAKSPPKDAQRTYTAYHYDIRGKKNVPGGLATIFKKASWSCPHF